MTARGGLKLPKISIERMWEIQAGMSPADLKALMAGGPIDMGGGEVSAGVLEKPLTDVPTTKAFRVLVTGSREWKDRRRLHKALEDVLREHESLIVVHGHNMNGADAMAHMWAESMSNSFFPVIPEPHPADWDTHGKSAGPIRNGEMVRLGADLCLAFLTPGCKGTVDCAAQAQAKGIPVLPFFSAR